MNVTVNSEVGELERERMVLCEQTSHNISLLSIKLKVVRIHIFIKEKILLVIFGINEFEGGVKGVKPPTVVGNQRITTTSPIGLLYI